MRMARSHHTATLLADGRVLIAGGVYTTAPIANVQIFDPKTRTFTAVASLKHARKDHTATLLVDGTVLIAGGAERQGTAEQRRNFRSGHRQGDENGSLNEARTLATASMLLDIEGTVLIEGGQDATGADLDTAEAYDPATASFTTLTAQMITPRSGHVGLTLPSTARS